MTDSQLIIRKATLDDAASIWHIFSEVISEGTTFVWTEDVTYETFLAFWFGPTSTAFAACIGEKIVGSYVLKPNQPGRGSHVANAAYMVSKAHGGKGIGFAMGEHSLGAAKDLGFQAMQFNIVVSVNTVAGRLWQKLGFTIVGTLPKVFNHPTLGLVDAYVMHRFI